MNAVEAQKLHEQRKKGDSGHDVTACWCCCMTCDFELITVGEYVDHFGEDELGF